MIKKSYDAATCCKLNLSVTQTTDNFTKNVFVFLSDYRVVTATET